MELISAFLATLVTFAALDVVFLMVVTQLLFQSDLPGLWREKLRLDVSAAFYALHVTGLVYFAVAPNLAAGSILVAARDGALLGLLAYGTYELTNMATVEGWTWRMVRLDLAWGTALSGLAAAVGTYFAARPMV